jgi:outer membrane immunogenic protein
MLQTLIRSCPAREARSSVVQLGVTVLRFVLFPILALIVAPAQAADLPEAVELPAPSPKFQNLWSGFYVGLNAGAAFSGIRMQAVPSQETFAFFPTLSATDLSSLRHTLEDEGFGLSSGVHLGFGKHFGPIVVGIESDFSILSGSGEASASTTVATVYAGGFPPGAEGAVAPFTYTSEARGQIDWLATGRLRVGFAPADRLFVYATGGLALGKVETGIAAELVPAGALLPEEVKAGYSGKGSSTHTGGVIGGGLEYAFSQRVSVRAEYLHVDLRDNSFGVTSDMGPRLLIPKPIAASSAIQDPDGRPAPVHPHAFITVHEGLQINVVRVGISYRF